jgi:uncharacterized protein YceK
MKGYRMRIIILTIVALVLNGCATLTPREAKQKNVLECISKMRGEDTEPMASFEICRQVYSLKKIGEGTEEPKPETSK